MAAQSAKTYHLVNIDRPAHSLDLSRAQSAHLKIAFDQPPRIVADCDSAGWRGGLQPRRQVACNADWCVLAPTTGLYDAHYHFAGVDPNARLHSRLALLR